MDWQGCLISASVAPSVAPHWSWAFFQWDTQTKQNTCERAHSSLQCFFFDSAASHNTHTLTNKVIPTMWLIGCDMGKKREKQCYTGCQGDNQHHLCLHRVFSLRVHGWVKGESITHQEESWDNQRPEPTEASDRSPWSENNKRVATPHYLAHPCLLSVSHAAVQCWRRATGGTIVVDT